MSGRTYSDEQLRHAVTSSRSWRGVLRHLGLAATSSAAIRSVRLQAARLELDTSHFTGQRRWTFDELAEAIAQSRSWSQVATLLGLAGGSGTSALKGHAARLGIDTSHMGSPAGLPAGLATMDPSIAFLPRAGSMLAASWFILCGYQVSWPLEPCRYDLVAGRGGDFLRVQVKTTRAQRAGSWLASLDSTGSDERVYDPDDIDYFFVIDGDLEYYLFPIASVGGLHQISLSSYQQFRLDRRMVSSGPSV